MIQSDRIEIKIILIDVSTGKQLNAVTLYGRSEIVSFGGVPDKLLRKPISDYVSSLYK